MVERLDVLTSASSSLQHGFLVALCRTSLRMHPYASCRCALIKSLWGPILMRVCTKHMPPPDFRAKKCLTGVRDCRTRIPVAVYFVTCFPPNVAITAFSLSQWEVIPGSYKLHYYFNPKTFVMQWSQPAGAVICKVIIKGRCEGCW